MKAHRRILSILAVAAMFMGPGPAQAATEKPKPDATNWYWQSQRRTKTSEIHKQECPEEAPACPDVQRDFPSPHAPGSLPVEVIQNEDEKISAISFDMDWLPIQGATIQKFTFTIKESTDQRDSSVNLDQHVVLACLATETWPTSEDGANLWADKPEFNCDTSAKGTRKLNPARWEFDITSLAQTWGQTPTAAYGVMLTGQKTDDENDTWRVVMAGPARGEGGSTTNKDAIKAEVQFTPKPPISTSYTTPYTSPSGFGFDSASDFPIAGTASPFPGSTPAPPVAGTAFGSPASNSEQGPRMPGYFWLILPIGLLSLSLVRHAVLEPLPGKRADGVVDLIRRHNAARLGRSVSSDHRSPFAAIGGFTRSAGHRLRRIARRAVRAGRKS